MSPWVDSGPPHTCRGGFSKALDFSGLHAAFWPLLLAAPAILGLSVALLKKQER